MRVKFKTNIDNYRTVSWPEMNGHVPRKGEIVYVQTTFDSYCTSKKIPNRLEVVSVGYEFSEYYNDVIASVELWFNETDYKLYGGGEKLLN